MECDFLPEYSHLRSIGGCIGLYRLFSNAAWRQVADPATKKVIIYPDPSAAIRGAKEAVRRKLNPKILVDETAPIPLVDEDEEDILGVRKFLEAKQEEAAQAKIFRKRKSMKPVIVERKEKRGPRHGAKAG